MRQRAGSTARVEGAATAVGVFRVNIKALSERRNRRGCNAFGKTFVVNLRDVVNAQAAFARRDVSVFAAHLNLQNFRVSGVFINLFQFAPVFFKLFKIVRVSDFMESAAEDGLRLVRLGHGDGFERMFGGDESVLPDKIDEIRALKRSCAIHALLLLSLET